MKFNPLIVNAAKDRHDDMRWICRECNSHVGTYNCNGSLIAERPEGASWDWWAACDNGDCKRSYGEGYFQDDPYWTRRIR